jgi:hypothetical protein
MADRSVSVRIVGLAEVNRALRQVADKVGGDGLKAALLGIAGKVATSARGKVPAGGSGKAAGSIQPHSTSRGASISFGGQAAPYMPWLDFGGSVGRGHVSGQAWSGAIKRDWMGRPVGEGRYVYPAISGAREETVQAVLNAIVEAALAADFEVH